VIGPLFADVVIVRVAHDLVAEVVRSQEHALIAVPLRQSGHRRVGAERATRMLAQPDADGDFGLAEFYIARRQREKGVSGCTAAERGPRRQTGHSRQPRYGLGVGHLQAAGIQALHLLPLDARVA
jgi:hypothetical protein